MAKKRPSQNKIDEKSTSVKDQVPFSERREVNRRHKKSQATAESAGQQLGQMGRTGRVPGSHEAPRFSGEGEEASREGLLKAERGALRQQIPRRELGVPAAKQQATD